MPFYGMYALEKRDLLLPSAESSATVNSEISQATLMNRPSESHSVYDTVKNQLPGSHSFANFIKRRRVSINRSSGSAYRLKILKRCGHHLKRFIERKVDRTVADSDEVNDNDNCSISTNSCQTITKLTDSPVFLHECKENHINMEILKDLQNQQSILSQEVNQLKQQFLEIQNVLVSIQNILINQIHLQSSCTSSMLPHPLNSSIYLYNNNTNNSTNDNANMSIFSPIIPMMKAGIGAVNFPSNNVCNNNNNNNNNNNGVIQNPLVSPNSLSYVTTSPSSSQYTSTTTVASLKLNDIYNPITLSTSFLPLRILTNSSSSENPPITSLSISSSFFPVLYGSSVSSCTPLSQSASKISLDNTINKIVCNLQTNLTSTDSSSIGRMHYMCLNEQFINALPSLTTTPTTSNTTQTRPTASSYSPTLIINPICSGYPLTTTCLNNVTSIDSLTFASSSTTLLSHNDDELNKLENSNKCYSDNNEFISSCHPKTNVNCINENIDPWDSPTTASSSIDSSQQFPRNQIEPLDTFEIAATVRDLLTKHNISQRQFCRHILRLSQGTMSELLSKPRPWHRLTARGRDSYRRLQAWITDPNNVNSLKIAQRKLSSVEAATQPAREVTSLSKQSQSVPSNLDPVEIYAPCSKDLSSAKSSTLFTPFGYRNDLEPLCVVTGQSQKMEPTMHYDLDTQKSNDPQHCYHQQSSKEINSSHHHRSLKSSESIQSDENLISREEQETERRINQILLAAKAAMDYEKQIKANGGATDKLIGESSDNTSINMSSVSECHMGVCSKSNGMSNPLVSSVSFAGSGFDSLQTTTTAVTSGSTINSFEPTAVYTSILNEESNDALVSSSHLSVYPNSYLSLRQSTVVDSDSSLLNHTNPFNKNISNLLCTPTTYCSGGSVQSIDDGSFACGSSINAVIECSNLPSSHQMEAPPVYPGTAVHSTEQSLPITSNSGITVSDLLKLLTSQLKNNRSVNSDKTQSLITLPCTINDSSKDFNNSHNPILNNSNIPLLVNSSSPSISSPYSSPMSSVSVNSVKREDCTPLYTTTTTVNEFSIPILSPSMIPINHHPPIIPPLGIPTSTSFFPQSSSSSSSMSLQHTLMLLASAAATVRSVPLIKTSSTPTTSEVIGGNSLTQVGSNTNTTTATNPLLIENDTVHCYNNSYETDDNLSDSYYSNNNNMSSIQKVILPPLKQEDIDKYSELSTEEVTHRTRSILSQHSISQRLFGAHVLGLSQGSVSDLLARPKPWKLLTQKGREPFIRMQLFLNNPDDIINSLQSSSICPQPLTQKLFSNEPTSVSECTGGSSNDSSSSTYVRSNSSISPGATNMDQERLIVQSSEFPCLYDNNNMSMLTNFKFMDKLEMLNSMSLGSYHSGMIHSNHQSDLKASSNVFMRQQCIDQTIVPTTLSNSSLYDSSQVYSLQTIDCSLFEPITSPSGSPTPNSTQNDYFTENENTLPLNSSSNSSIHNSNNNQSVNVYQRPSSKKVMELATSITDLDTASMCGKIKELLQRHSIPQRLFGDVVLGMCQASVSDILSKTRPWSQLSNKARIPYVRLHLWLQEPDHLEILKAAQTNIKTCTRPNNNTKIIQGHNSTYAGYETSTTIMEQPTSDLSTRQFLLSTKPESSDLTSSPDVLSKLHSVTTSTSVSTRKRTLSSSSLSTSLCNQENSMNSPKKSGKLLKINSSQITPSSSPNHKTRNTANSQASVDQLNEYERQSLFDIAKAATTVMLLASNANSSYRQNRSKSNVPISPTRNVNTKSPKLTSPNKNKPNNLRSRKLHHLVDITQSQKDLLTAACKNQLSLSTENIRSLAHELCLPYKTVLSWIHNYQTRIQQNISSRSQAKINSDLHHEKESNGELLDSVPLKKQRETRIVTTTTTNTTSTISHLSSSFQGIVHKQLQHNRRKPINPTRLACSVVVIKNSPGKSLHTANLSNSNEHENSVVPVT
ncbi:Homeobox protein [Schistosoma japonicum]|uniref:Homeobox protein n=1 Tax=Schistosoma japonicum TaxID=6182 RepID=A0A4Z2DNW3_SCHJA|nr:Homeobox protein [Schistosoma japonicum]